jgi:hypothetical protein
MVICKISCPAYNSCKERQPHQRCIYDLGMFNGEEDKFDDIDDIIDRFTY